MNGWLRPGCSTRQCRKANRGHIVAVDHLGRSIPSLRHLRRGAKDWIDNRTWRAPKRRVVVSFAWLRLPFAFGGVSADFAPQRRWLCVGRIGFVFGRTA